MTKEHCNTYQASQRSQQQKLLCFLAGCFRHSQQKANKRTMTLADLFDQHAEVCMKTAERTDDPVRRPARPPIA